MQKMWVVVFLFFCVFFFFFFFFACLCYFAGSSTKIMKGKEWGIWIQADLGK